MRVETTDIGNVVICDLCSADYTLSHEPGGIMFGSKAACPRCAPRLEKDAEKYGESHYITGRCTPGMPYRDWVIALRGGNNKVTVISGTSAEVLGAMESARARPVE